jgi:hypothetical protein
VENASGGWQAVISVGVLTLVMTAFLAFGLVHDLMQIQGY